jgi:protein ImuB
MNDALALCVCVRVPDYALAVTVRGDDSTDALLLADRYDRGHVIALNDAARSYGARAGQTLTQAAAAVPHARIVVYDPVHARAVWHDMLDALDAVTPLIEDADGGTAFLDMRGIAGDLERHATNIHVALERFALPLRIGAAANRFAAYAATWLGALRAIAPGEEAARLAPLPLEVLELDPNARARLHVLGIETLGELAKLPHGPFVRRFGREAARWHEWARGIDRRALCPRGHEIAIEATMFGEGHAEDEASVIFALRILLARICSDLERCGRRAGSLQLDVELDNGETTAFDVPLAAPTAQERGMLDVLRAKLENVTFNAPLVGLRLRVARLEEGGEPQPLIRSDDIDRENVAVVLARLEAMLGRPVRRARTRHAHPVEERYTYEPFGIPPRDRDGAARPPVRVVPQLRLLTVTPVDVRVRRGEPLSVNGRTVVRCAGPWRIEEGWFATPVTRDEYDVVLQDGEICRIYRQGTHWYLRGFYD